MRRSLLSVGLASIVLLSTLGCGSAPPPAPAAPIPVVAPLPEAPAPPPPPVKASASPDGAALGQLDFPVTGTAECQRKFREGMLALHSFLYDQAHESFAAALVADPKCAMAAWGEAMTYDHPVWRERDLAKGRAALARVSSEEGLTAKERAYLAAARALFAKDDLKQAHAAWLAAAAAMHADYADDDEVELQHVLAILSVYGYDPAHMHEQVEAGAMALSVLQRRPEHPGAAHYTIHAFDNPTHAILALPAARTYARIAPAAGHAQHMPSHIFTQLGMWREVVPSNEKAYAASMAWEKAHGHTPSNYDWHSYSWLVAAHLELGQPAMAKKLIEEAGALLAASKDDSAELRDNYSGMVTDYVTHTDRWSEMETLVVPVFAPAVDEGREGAGPVACASHAPGAGGEVRFPAVLAAREAVQAFRAEAAVRAGDEATVAKRIADAKAVRAQMAPWAKMISAEFTARRAAHDDALLARAHAVAKPSPASQKKAIEALERLARAESTESPSGPAWERTTKQTLGEMLLASGKPKEALAQFELDLADRPSGSIALLGAARAAKAAGELERARGYYAVLADLWRDADNDLPALTEVRAGAR
jgi:hypothetical protein